MQGLQESARWLLLQVGGGLFVDVLAIRALLFRVDDGAFDFWKLPDLGDHERGRAAPVSGLLLTGMVLKWLWYRTLYIMVQITIRDSP